MKRTYTLIISLALALAAGAQTHGEGGYYDWTPTRLNALGTSLFYKSQGTASSDIAAPSLTYTDDYEYAMVTMGVQTTDTKYDATGTAADDGSYYNYRTDLYLSGRSKSDASERAIMTLTKDYPVVAFKVSIPNGDQSDGLALSKGYLQSEIIYNYVTTDSETNTTSNVDGALGDMGLSSKNYTFLYFGGNHTVNGTKYVGLLDSTTPTDESEVKYYAEARSYTGSDSQTHPIYTVRRLTTSEMTTADEGYTDYIITIDFTPATFTDGTNTGLTLGDGNELPISLISFKMMGVYADPESKGYEQPTWYMKWIKTFASLDAVQQTMDADHGFGDRRTLPTHGEGGYYDWTPDKLGAYNESTGWIVTANGTANSSHTPSVTYGETYTEMKLGVYTDEKDETEGGHYFSTNFKFSGRDNSRGTDIMAITNDYPVVVVKLSLPEPEYSVTELTNNMQMELIYNTYSTDGSISNSANKFTLSGLSSGKFNPFYYGGGSVNLTTANNDNGIYITQLPDSSGEAHSDILIAFNLAKASFTDVDGNTCTLANGDVLHLSMMAMNYQGAYVDYEKYADPVVYLKWIKTFANMTTFKRTLDKAHSWGDLLTATAVYDDDGDEEEEEEEPGDEEEEQPDEEVAKVELSIPTNPDDQQHGKKGYYNWTPARIEAYASTSNGTAVDGYKTSAAYGEDYVTVTMGVNNATADTVYNSYQHRANINLQNKTEDGIMKMTADRPIVAFKVGAPTVRTASSSQKISDAYMELEVLYWGIPTDASESTSTTLGSVAGLTSSGRCRFLQFGGNTTDDDGQPIVYLNISGTNTGSNVSELSNDAGTAYVCRLASDSGEELTPFIYAIDLSAGMTDGAITITGLNLGVINIYADYEAEGYVAPQYSLKWIKTFTSMDDLKEAIAEEYNYADLSANRLLSLNEDPANAGVYYATYSSYQQGKLLEGDDVPVPYTCEESKDGTVLTFNPVVAEDGYYQLNANTGYLFRGGKDPADIRLLGKYDTELTYDKSDLEACLESTEATTGMYALTSNGSKVAFYQLTDGNSIQAGQAYYLGSTDSEVAAMVFAGDDEATAISSTRLPDCSSAQVYDLTGRRVSAPTKGLYIVNGKKILY